MNRVFLDYFRCPENADIFRSPAELRPESGYFRFGKDVVCFGPSSAPGSAHRISESLPDLAAAAGSDNGWVLLPFDPGQIVDNLRREIYAGHMQRDVTRFEPNRMVRSLYYFGRPFLPLGLRRILQRIRLQGSVQTPFPKWPVDTTVDVLLQRLLKLSLKARNESFVPFIWFWPDAASAAMVLTHDVETEDGLHFCPAMMDMDDAYGLKSSFQLVPEKRYQLSEELLRQFRTRGFEANIHDLNHDGNLFRERGEFLERAKKINAYARKFDSSGFRSGVLYRNLLWYDALDFQYDMSVPNVGHLDPQSGGCCTVFPYFIGNILEIPVTLTQDYSLFHILNQYSLDLWKEQVGIISKNHGLISVIVHPDYVTGGRAQDTYRELLSFFAGLRDREGVWAALPQEINRWWRQRHALRLVLEGESWQIEGEGKERARVAYAHIVNGELVYSFERPRPVPVESLSAAGTESAANDIERNVPGREVPRHGRLIAGDRPVEIIPPQPLPDGSRATMPTMESIAIPAPARAKAASQTPRATRPLRVCMVAYTFYETDNRVMRYAETLARQGHEVDVLALRRAGASKEEVINGVRVFRLQPRHYDETTRFAYAWKLSQFFVRAFLRVSARDLKSKYDLLHVHSVPDMLVFTALLPRLRGTPVILDIHDILPEFYASKFKAGTDAASFKLLCAAEKLCGQFSSHVIIANDIWRERLLSRHLAAEKCTVVLNSPDRLIFQRGSQAPARNGRFVMLYPGTLNWHQGLDIAVRAFARVSKELPDADFHIYGNGPAKDDLIRMVEDFKLEDRVLFKQSRPLREIATIMESADLGIVPKRKDTFGNEAFSTKILEFMAMGVPVIVSDTQVDRFYFNDSVVRFFRGGDEEDLARQMLDVARNAAMRTKLAGNASAFVESMDWDAKQHIYLDLVERLVQPAERAEQ